MGEDFPACPQCGSRQVLKVPSVFSFKDASSTRTAREKAILKRARDYLIDGKYKDAQRFLEKAKEFHPTDRIKRLSEALSERKPTSGYFVSKPEVVITKKKGS
jgi:hypothetical protein